jgi:hypothetical protein
MSIPNFHSKNREKSMNLFRLVASIFCAVVLTACATRQEPVSFNTATLKVENRIGVVLTSVPKVDLTLPGASCLLCYAVASAANSSLNKHTQALPTTDVLNFKDELASVLRKKGLNATAIAEPLYVPSLPDFSGKAANVATKDFSSFQKKHGFDKLLVIDITALGVERTYATYVPTGAPRAYLVGTGYLVNLSNNTYEWYLPLQTFRAAEGNWDEPPTFPGLTNAYFQVIEVSKDELLKPFSN